MKEKPKEKPKDKGQEKPKDKAKDKGKEKTKDKGKDKTKDKGKDKGKEKSKEKAKGTEKGTAKRTASDGRRAKPKHKSRWFGDPADEKNFTRREKCLIYLLALALSVGTASVALLFIFQNMSNEGDKDILDRASAERKYCLTMNCVNTAKVIINKYDPNVDPCEDFAKYACGNFYNTTTLDEGTIHITGLTTLQKRRLKVLKSILSENVKPGDLNYVKNMKKFYKSCIDTDKMEQVGIQPYLNTPYAKEWPTLNGPGNITSLNISDLNARYTPLSVFPLLKIGPGQDFADHSKHAVWISFPERMRLSRETLIQDRWSTVFLSYRKYLENFAVLLGADPAVAKEDAENVVELEREIGKILPTRTQLTKMHKATELRQLEKDYPFIDIRQSIQAVFDLAGITLKDDQKVIVPFPDYIRKLEHVIQATDNRTLMNLFGFDAAFKLVGGMTRKIRMIMRGWHMMSGGYNERAPRPESCLEETSWIFSFGLAKEFVRRTFSNNSKAYLSSMVEELKASFKEAVGNANWMSNSTKTVAFRKLDKMKKKVGYPDTHFDDQDFEKKYRNLTMIEDNFYENKLTVHWTMLIKALKEVKGHTAVDEWSLPPSDINAYYSPYNNDIVLLAAILHRPTYSEIFPNAMNYGAIGSIIGHEMTHGFDSFGSGFDGDGVIRQWWRPEERADYEAHTWCFRDQYRVFRVEALRKLVNGTLTLGENIADNVGLKQSYRAYRRHVEEHGDEKQLPGLNITNNQLFFLSYAQLWCEVATLQMQDTLLHHDIHSPGRYRIIGPLQNSPDFARAFKCKTGSKMNPEEKCSVW